MYLSTDSLMYLTAQDVMACAEDSQNRNRALDTKALREDLDPDGISLMFFKMMHNGHEWRTILALKVKDSMEPVEVFRDISFELMERIEAKQEFAKLILGVKSGRESDQGSSEGDQGIDSTDS